MLIVLEFQLKRLRELAALIIESDATETLPSDGIGVATSGSDASAAASTGAGDSSISDIKQNIDQVILKYVKEVNTWCFNLIYHIALRLGVILHHAFKLVVNRFDNVMQVQP